MYLFILSFLLNLIISPSEIERYIPLIIVKVTVAKNNPKTRIPT